MDPDVSPFLFRRQLCRKFRSRRSSHEIKRAMHSRARALNNGFLCLFVSTKIRSCYKRSRTNPAIAYNAKQQKNPLTISVRFAKTFLVVSEFFDAIRKFKLVVFFFFVFFFSFNPSSLSLFIINAMETRNIEWLCLMFQLFRRKQ